MHKLTNNFAFIDNTNIHKGIGMLGWKLDFAKFRKLLKERYGVIRAYMFIGYMAGNQDMYRDFQNMGYTLIFKPTLPKKDGGIKGNCDAELVLQAMIDLNSYDNAVIITGDGDFQCLVKYLRKINKLGYVLSPNRKWCSILLKREARGNHVFIEEMRSKLEHK
ncbi:MAG: NYN domain-containing protein [Candidatus Spechtbacteria bacterium]|nr:NYN domain-containing protein [Candidatus Spechtbacteria bacterium]